MFLLCLDIRTRRRRRKKKHSHMKQLKPKLPLQFRSNAVPRCGMRGLFKDPVFPTDDLLLMVEFCKHFGVWRRWQQPEGVPHWRWSLKRKEKTPETLRGSLHHFWCGPMATARIWQLSDKGLAAETHGFLSGPLCLDAEEMRRREAVASLRSCVWLVSWRQRDLNWN